jgi:hypothetical protein
MRVSSQPCRSTAFRLVTGDGPPGSPGPRPESRTGHPAYFPQFTGNLMHNLLRSSPRRGWRDRSVLSRRPPGTMQRLLLGYAVTAISKRPGSPCWCGPYRHSREASTGSMPGLMNGQQRPGSWPGEHKMPRAEFHNLPAIQRRSRTSSCPRSRSKRASHALAVHEPRQRPLTGHREVPGRTPADAYQLQRGYGLAALLATHFPAEPALQDHGGSHYSLGI